MSIYLEEGVTSKIFAKMTVRLLPSVSPLSLPNRLSNPHPPTSTLRNAAIQPINVIQPQKFHQTHLKVHQQPLFFGKKRSDANAASSFAVQSILARYDAIFSRTLPLWADFTRSDASRGPGRAAFYAGRQNKARIFNRGVRGG